MSNEKDIIIEPQEGFQKSFVQSNVDVVFGGGVLAAGKMQPLNAKILTPFGWQTMGDMKIGSMVITPFSGVANVTAIFPQGVKDVYEFCLVDGRKCECGIEHLWTVFDKTPTNISSDDELKGSITVTTRFLIENMRKGKKFFVPNPYLKEYENECLAMDYHTQIKSIKKIRRAECQCILVDDKDHLYITDDLIVTHNSFALVLAMAEPLMTDPDFRAMISRRSLGNQKAGGGFVEKFKQIFGSDYIKVKESDSPRVSFPNGTFVDLTYLDDSNIDKLRERAKGWEYDMIAIDELTEMSWEVFSYVMTRNRGQSKTFTGKFFATLNPKRSHWTRIFLDWYIGPDGFVIPERDGKVRYFYCNGPTVKDVVWGDSKREVYEKCKLDIDRKLAAVGGNFTYKNMIKSFVFYKGKISENKGLVGNNANYIGSVAASGGRMAQALLEGNFNVDAEEEENIPIASQDAKSVFTQDPAVTGEKWITIDLADYGTDNAIYLAWNGFDAYDIDIVTNSTPRSNAEHARVFAAKHGISLSHIIYDATAGRYFNDYIPEAIPYISAAKPMGIYALSACSVKDLCYLRLCQMIKRGEFTMSDNVAEKVYTHQNLKYRVTVENEFLEECSVVRFSETGTGRKRLWSKKEMNRNLGKGRSMDLLDPCAMRMYPCMNMEYGTEIEQGFSASERESNEVKPGAISIYSRTLWG